MEDHQLNYSTHSWKDMKVLWYSFFLLGFEIKNINLEKKEKKED